MLPPKYLQIKAFSPSVTRLGERQTTREVVRLAEKIVNMPPLKAEYAPIEMKNGGELGHGLGYSKSYDIIYEAGDSNNLIGAEVTTTLFVNNKEIQGTTTTLTYNEVISSEVFDGNIIGIEANIPTNIPI